jgi:hypothetical protein
LRNQTGAWHGLKRGWILLRKSLNLKFLTANGNSSLGDDATIFSLASSAPWNFFGEFLEKNIHTSSFQIVYPVMCSFEKTF